MKACRGEGRDLLLGCEDHLRVFNRVIEVVLFHARSEDRRSTSLSQTAPSAVGRSTSAVMDRRYRSAAAASALALGPGSIDPAVAALRFLRTGRATGIRCNLPLLVSRLE